MELFAVGSDSGSHGFFLLRKAIFRKNAQVFRSPKAERSATRTGAEGMKTTRDSGDRRNDQQLVHILIVTPVISFGCLGAAVAC